MQFRVKRICRRRFADGDTYAGDDDSRRHKYEADDDTLFSRCAADVHDIAAFLETFESFPSRRCLCWRADFVALGDVMRIFR